MLATLAVAYSALLFALFVQRHVAATLLLLAAQAQRASDHADVAVRTKARFVNNISHELLTPLNGILGLTRLLLGTELSAVQREWVENLEDSGRMLLTLTNHVLDLSRLESGKVELRRERLRCGIWCTRLYVCAVSLRPMRSTWSAALRATCRQV